MSEAFLGELRMVSFNFPPKGWAFCNGQFLPINQNQALFSLLGTTYGGDGRTTFALPDLRARVPMHMGQGHTQGERGGQTAHTLTSTEMPTHMHLAQATNNNGDNVVPTDNVFGSSAGTYGPPANMTNLNPATVTDAGGSQAHQNQQPYLVLNFCIALQGIFPSRN